MYKFPSSFIKQVKDATDMLALASEYTEMQPAGGEVYSGRCPHPDHNDSTPSFRVWTKAQSWSCMGCHTGKKDSRFQNYGSDCFAFVSWMTNGRLSFYDAVKFLAERVGLALPTDPNQAEYKKIMAQAIKYSDALDWDVIAYLNGRGLEQADIEEWGIGYDTQRSRITFPLPDACSNLIAFSTRRFKDDDTPKYINSSTSAIFQKGTYLYGLHKLDKNFPEIRITEGQLDVILSLKHGVKNIVGTLGTAFTEYHVDKIKELGMQPVIVMDNDDAGQHAMTKIAEMLLDKGIVAKVATLPAGKDMADMANTLKGGLEDWINENAIFYWHHLLSSEIRKYEAEVNNARFKLLSPARAVLDRCQDPVQKDLIVNYLKDQAKLEVLAS